jgi:hypothetical protein
VRCRSSSTSAFGDELLVKPIDAQGLAQRKDVLWSVVAHERLVTVSADA